LNDKPKENKKTLEVGHDKRIEILSFCFGRIFGAKRQKPGFPLVSFAACGVKRIPLQSLTRSMRELFSRVWRR
jgi:hypothetical protein